MYDVCMNVCMCACMYLYMQFSVCVLLLLVGKWVGRMIIVHDEDAIYYNDPHSSINKISLTTRKITVLIHTKSNGLDMDRDAG